MLRVPSVESGPQGSTGGGRSAASLSHLPSTRTVPPGGVRPLGRLRAPAWGRLWSPLRPDCMRGSWVLAIRSGPARYSEGLGGLLAHDPDE